jgi:cellulose synthase/poly-beta-1,6-N-acetylglucosamine synthase-like glycosyltransferase
MILFLIITFAAATLLQIGYWLFLFSRILKVKSKIDIDEKQQKPISVVICAKNEEKNLSKKLVRILNQNYRFLEILVVNDQSSDKTEQVLLEYQKKYSYLRIINNLYTKKSAGKKDALALGLSSATHETIAVTDADCTPSSENWLGKMSSLLTTEKEIVLGYGPYQTTGTLLNKFIRFETIMTAIQYFSYALAGIPYMGVGRNMLYRKKLFAEANGFSSHEQIASGDDDLFIREVATSNNVAISLDPDTFIYSASEPNLHAFFRQKIRHLSTGTHYRLHHKILLGFYGASQAWHYFAFFLLILSKNFILLTISLYLFRIFTVAFLCKYILSKLRERFILTSIVWLDAAMALYYIIAAPLPFIAKTRTWK